MPLLGVAVRILLLAICADAVVNVVPNGTWGMVTPGFYTQVPGHWNTQIQFEVYVLALYGNYTLNISTSPPNIGFSYCLWDGGLLPSSAGPPWPVTGMIPTFVTCLPAQSTAAVIPLTVTPTALVATQQLQTALADASNANDGLAVFLYVFIAGTIFCIIIFLFLVVC